jgi:ribulose-5-phosphate 4-epimerase/fuculose-1-phosphate aldolase
MQNADRSDETLSRQLPGVRSASPAGGVSSQFSPEEWALRVDLAAAYRLVALFDWDDLVFTHITAKLPGPERHFLINPYGMMFEEITASSLVKIDPQGQKIDENPWPINPAGFAIHSAIHAARSDIVCVLHTHTLNGVAVSTQKNGVLPISQQSIFVLNSLAYHDYEGLALREEEKPRLVADLGQKYFLMLRNHGLLTVGRTVAEAFQAMYTFEATCAIQLRAQAGGGELIPVRQGIIETAPEQAREASNGMRPHQLIWPGLLRRLDRIDSSYRS